MKSDPRFKLAREAKALVALALRNGPVEDLHAGKTCPTCSSNNEYSQISDPEMKKLMKYAVDRVYSMLLLRERAPDKYEALLKWADFFTSSWDQPRLTKDF